MHPCHPGDAYDDWQLTPNFELWTKIFLCADMFPYEDSKILSVCPYPNKRNNPSFVNISPTVVIDAWVERCLRDSMETQIFSLKKKIEIEFYFC